MKTYTEQEWAEAQYTGRWGDNPWNRSRVEAGDVPAAYIGRRTIMVGSIHGCTLLTEGFHFFIDDEEGRRIREGTFPQKKQVSSGAGLPGPAVDNTSFAKYNNYILGKVK